MENSIKYISKNVKLALKSVVFNYKQYLCFFIAIFIVQIFYGIITISANNNNKITFESISSEYNYHIILKDLNEDQYNYMMSDTESVFISDKIFEMVKVIEYGDNEYFELKYDMYIKFIEYDDDIYASNRRFSARYYNDLASLSEENLRVQASPLLNYQKKLNANNTTYAIYIVIVSFVSIFTIMTLYNIRINHYKFIYGIYMTYGADFKKLFSTALWEMVVISFITIIPACVSSYLVNYAIYTHKKVNFYFNFSSLFIILLLSLIVAGIAIYFPMLKLSMKTPVSNIIAEDNSNIVVSPMNSFNMFGKKFPIYYENYSIWRFRKYIIQLLLSSAAFCVLFTATIFYADLYMSKINNDTSQFKVDFLDTGHSYMYESSMHDELMNIKGITEVQKLIYNPENDNMYGSTLAIDSSSHILVSRSNVKPFSNFVIYPQNSQYNAINDCYYSFVDEEIIEYLKKYEHEGNIDSILTQDDTIIISDSINNTSRFNFKIGDKILLATKTGQTRNVEPMMYGKSLLKQQLLFYKFEYKQYTIGAILKNYPTNENFPIFMYTNKPLEYSTAYLYIDKFSSVEETKRIENDLREWAKYYGNIRIINTGAGSTYRLELDMNQYLIYLSLAFLMLAISPLVWFFSQTMFYLKREKEFTILQSIGAIDSEIKKIYRIGGFFTALSSSILCFLLSYAGIYAVFKWENVVSHKFSRIFMRYDFNIPIYAFIIVIVISILCGILSAYIPYLLYNKKTKSENIESDK